MKVILSVDAVKYPLTGIGRYVYELSKGLMHSDEVETPKFFKGTGVIENLPQATDRPYSGHGLKRLVQKSGLVTELYRVMMPVIKRRSLAGHEDHIYHGPNFTLPPFSGLKVATFHDLSPFTWSECHEPVKGRYLQKELRNTLQRADGLITDSEFIRRELIDFSGYPAERIHTVPLAAGPEFCVRTEAEVKPFLDKYDLSYQGYSLFVGSIEPRKNLLALLDAYGRLPLDVRQRWPLILAGYQGWKSEAIHQRIQEAEREGWARYLGFLPAQELPLLYSGARLFAFPSLYEGFGLPVLEAMQSGVPVVCSNSASLPEVAGDAAVMAAAEDVEGITEAMNMLLNDAEQREAFIRLGLDQAQRFTWSQCVSGTVEVYKALTEGGHSSRMG